MDLLKLSEMEYFDQNRSSWDDRVHIHVKSDFYDLYSFLRGASSLTEIEQEYLGNVDGQRILHLQCHFGMDTLSMSRMGADCTGIDFSGKAIVEAKKLNDQLNQNAIFYESNVYDVLKLGLGQFDKVFASYGTIGWLPDLDRWAKVISESLTQNGEFYICDFHPALYMFDFNTNQLAYSYFNIDAPYTEDESGSYADRNYNKSMITHFWSHSLDEIITSLLNHGLRIKQFKEFDFSPFSCFPNMRSIGKDRYRFGSDEIRIPHLYLIKAVKNASE
jgi:2-polyprenyl-3-methyl-5-hydroxy-6-metoxy-1,4-benzoquinol methylase